MQLQLNGEATKLQPGDKLVYDGKRVHIYRGRQKCRFAGGLEDRFLVPQAWSDGFQLASIISYVTGLPFVIDRSNNRCGYLFGEKEPDVIDAEFRVVQPPQIPSTKHLVDKRV
jgi:hypothetical protein